MSTQSQDQDIFEKLADQGPVAADQLLKEDEILGEEDKKKPEPCKPLSEGVDAQKKPKKACANCTCGLADELEKEARDSTTKSTTESGEGAGKSSCGSCYLGDAFRCASCPYRGMPAFKPGEKVTIDVGSDDI